MRYREVTPGDIPALFEIRTSTIENAITVEEIAEYGITPESLADALETDIKGWLCEDAGKPVGFTLGNSESGEMLVVAVLPEYEGRGIGRELMVRIQEWLFSKGHDEIWLYETPDPDIRAYGFYRKLGWLAEGECDDNEQILKLYRHKCSVSKLKQEKTNA